ncbi:MAG: RloB domain-containing protein [Sedimentisphaerales bacterium]|nr:RloB domain-containing protein [Sedimentisphaerales bacterium]MBN2843192.1 RloB domain-containing protein [Sedimentisphaerales bacterium]
MSARIFTRRPAYLKYRRLFLLSVEGYKTEPQYFAMFNDMTTTISIRILKDINHNSPRHVLDRVKKELKRTGLKKDDQAWLVVDKDQWPEQQLYELYQWSSQSDAYGLAVTNPKFELWLLWHFEDTTDLKKLKKYLPDYDKGIEARKLDRNKILKAVNIASRRDNPPSKDWPRKSGSTVYRLVNELMSPFTGK